MNNEQIEEALKKQKQLYKTFRLDTIVAYRDITHELSLGQIVFISERNNILIKPIKIDNKYGTHIEYTGKIVFTKEIYNLDRYKINIYMEKTDFTDEIKNFLQKQTVFSLFK